MTTETTDDAPPVGEPQEEEQPEQDPTTETPDPDTPEVPKDKQVESLRREAANYRTRLRATEAELVALRDSAATDTEAAIETARAEARAEAMSEALTEATARLVRGEVLAAAANPKHRLADPADAIAFLDLASFEVDEQGHIDADAVSAAIAELLKAKPYLSQTRDPEFGARPSAPAGAKTMDDFLRGA